jgi:sulfoxide reductase heme-binding subunit YedZ
MRRWLRPASWVAVIAPIPVIVAYFFLGKLGANPIREVEHMTGEWALRFLAASLAVTPLMRLTGAGWLVAERRFLGLAAFFWAVGHLLVYTVLDWFFDWHEIWKDILKHWYVTLGMLAFLLMIPLALTSTKASIKRLGGKKWNALHRLVYVSVAAACLHFFWAVKKDRSEPILYGTVVAVLLASRLIWRGGRRPSVRSGLGSAATEPTG